MLLMIHVHSMIMFLHLFRLLVLLRDPIREGLIVMSPHSLTLILILILIPQVAVNERHLMLLPVSRDSVYFTYLLLL